MLVLSRMVGETIELPEIGVTIAVTQIRGDTVRIGVEAPDEVTILRGELESEPDRQTRRGERDA